MRKNLKTEILEILETIELHQTAWEGDEDIMTFNGKPIGGTIHGNIGIDRWWPELRERLAEYISSHLAEK